MGSVYRVSSMDWTEYFNTRRDAEGCKPFDEEPEELLKLDAASECNRLERANCEIERAFNHVRRLLADLMEVCDEPTSGSHAYRAALSHFATNPLEPATSAERRGGGSYGTG